MKNDKICVVLKTTKILKEHQVIYRDIYYFKNKNKKMCSISYVY